MCCRPYSAGLLECILAVSEIGRSSSYLYVADVADQSVQPAAVSALTSAQQKCQKKMPEKLYTGLRTSRTIRISEELRDNFQLKASAAFLLTSL